MCTREIQHCIDDKVKASQIQYTRARRAVHVLRGGGDWENTLQVLLSADVRALNERVLTRGEKDKEKCIRAQAGIVNSDSEDTDNADDSENDLDEVRVVAKPADVGSGRLWPSWIWYATSSREDMSDPMMLSGK